MTKRTRMILWLLLVFLFFILTPSVILYSQGYRVDWKAKRIVQTGALYFKIIPTRTNVLVDGKLQKTTDFFFGSALPGSHYIQISKEGYQPWAKQLEVQERQVTDAKNIILFPQIPEFTIAADNVQRVWKTPKKNTLLLQKNTSKFWKLVLFNTETLREETIFTPEVKETLWDVQWSPDQTQIILQVVQGEDIHSSVLALEKGQPCYEKPCSLDFLGQPLDMALFSGVAEDRVIFSKYVRNSIVLGEADFVQKEVLTPLANNVITFTTQGATLIWFESSGKLWQKDTAQDQALLVASLPAPLREETEYSIHPIGNALFLKEGTRLLWVDTREKNMKEIFSEARIIEGSPDGKKLAVSNGSEMWVMYLQDSQGQPYHQTGDKVFLTRLSKSIDTLSWISSHYLVFSADTDIQTIEIDERDTVNTSHLVQFPSPSIFWQEASKALAVLSQGNLYISEALVQ
jgi:hypothetical protein